MCVCVCLCVCVECIYILTNLLFTSIHGDKEKKKPCQNSEITNL